MRTWVALRGGPVAKERCRDCDPVIWLLECQVVFGLVCVNGLQNKSVNSRRCTDHGT